MYIQEASNEEIRLLQSMTNDVMFRIKKAINEKGQKVEF